jgi:hypothetical protein
MEMAPAQHSFNGSLSPQPTDDLRAAAVERLKKKREFYAHAIAYVLVNGFLVALWAITSPEAMFWPVFPILGWGIGLAFHAFDTFSKPTFSEDRIRKEMDRIR